VDKKNLGFLFIFEKIPKNKKEIVKFFETIKLNRTFVPRT
jgi:hypothetical protein